MIESDKLFFGRVSVNERMKPIKPVNRSVMINPIIVNTKTSSLVTAKRVERNVKPQS